MWWSFELAWQSYGCLVVVVFWKIHKLNGVSLYSCGLPFSANDANSLEIQIIWNLDNERTITETSFGLETVDHSHAIIIHWAYGSSNKPSQPNNHKSIYIYNPYKLEWLHQLIFRTGQCHAVCGRASCGAKLEDWDNHKLTKLIMTIINTTA